MAKQKKTEPENPIAHDFITSKFSLPKGRTLKDEDVLQVDVKNLKKWLEDYYKYKTKKTNNQNEQSKENHS